ncbi:MAG: DUF1640 domain-containing protein [Methylococcaceae bacterium]
MTTLTFDTHEFFKELKDAGFSEQQAEVITKLQKNTVHATLEQARHDYELDNIATKRDLRELELRLESKIKDIDLKIAETKTDLQRWIVTVVFGVGILQTAIIAVLLLKVTGH